MEGRATRTFVFALAVWGGLYGLILNSRRLRVQRKQTKTSQRQVTAMREQVAVGQSNLFNDRLGRAVEGLGNKDSMTLRNAGIGLLESPAKSSESGSGENELCIKILHGFIRERAIMPSRGSSGALPAAVQTDEGIDILTAVKVLSMLVPISNRSEFYLNNLDLRNLDFSNLQLSNFRFGNSIFSGASQFHVNFSEAWLSDADFSGINSLFFSDFSSAILWDTNFSNCNLRYCDFQGTSKGVRAKINFTSTFLGDCNFSDANLAHSNFEKTRFDAVDISSADFDSATNLSQSQIDECFFEQGKDPQNLPLDANGVQLTVDQTQYYKWEKNSDDKFCRQFVVSGKWIDNFTPRWKEDES